MPSDSIPGAFSFLRSQRKSGTSVHRAIPRHPGLLARGKGRGDATVRVHAHIRRGAWVPRRRPRRDATYMNCRFETGGNAQSNLDR